MEIISLNFILFVIIVLVVYYLLERRAQNYWLLAASYVFCATWNISFAVTLVITTLFNFFTAKLLWRENRVSKGWLWAGLLVNLLPFAFFKLTSGPFHNLIFSTASNLVPAGQFTGMEILLPVGFSFYILQAVSYLLDVYHKRIAAHQDLVDFALYMAYFPRLVSGPIERARTFLPKLAKQRLVDNAALSRGFTLILQGLVRKIIIADTLFTIIPTDVFVTPRQFSISTLIISILIYAFWLYNDFAGYTSIVRGISCWFGIELSPNFQFPYLSQNFSEFWNRWHISLSSWLKDYIYFPLSRTLLRRNPDHHNLINLVIPPLVTMLASGLWHNFSFAMLAWGGLHALYQIVERFLPFFKTGGEKPGSFWQPALRILIVFTLTFMAWVTFATGDFSRTLDFWGALFSAQGKPAIALSQVILPFTLVLISIVLDFLYFHTKDETFILKWPRLAQASLLLFSTLAIVFALIWKGTAVIPFKYQGF